MGIEDHGRTIEELADLVGVPVRTIRYYITEGLLPGPGTRGKGAVYGEEHLLRLRLIRTLVDQRIPLAEIADKLAGLTLTEMRALLNEEQRRAEAEFQAALSPRDYISALLCRARMGRSSTSRAPTAPPSIGEHRPSVPQMEQAPVEPGLGAEEWQRWTLAPGLELHARADAMERYRGLIEQMLRMARPLGNRQPEQVDDPARGEGPGREGKRWRHGYQHQWKPSGE